MVYGECQHEQVAAIRANIDFRADAIGLGYELW
jgi:hypothetical protein